MGGGGLEGVNAILMDIPPYCPCFIFPLPFSFENAMVLAVREKKKIMKKKKKFLILRKLSISQNQA